MVPIAQVSVNLDGALGGLIPLLIFGVVIAGIVGGLILRWRQRKARDELAAAEGWEPIDRHWVRAHVLPRLPRSSGAFGERITWAVKCPGRDGDPDVVLCDYQYKTRSHSRNRNGRSRNNTQTHRRSAAILHNPTPLPAMSIKRSGLLGKVLSAVGARGLEVESADFNRKFRVTAKNHRVAVAVLSPETQARLLEFEPDSLHVQHGWVLSVDSNRAKPQRYPQLRDCTLTIIHGIPGWVVEELTTDDSAPDWELEESEEAV